MEKPLLTKDVLLKKCKKPLLTELCLYAGCMLLCLGLGALFLRYLPETPLLYPAFFFGAAFFAAPAGRTFLQLRALLKGRYTLVPGTVSHKRPRSICDTRAYTLTFRYGEEPVKTVRTAEISPAEYAEAKEGKEYLLALVDILHPRVVGFFPSEAFALPGAGSGEAGE